MTARKLPSPLFVVEMEKVVVICDRLDQGMIGVQYKFENDTIRAFEAMHEIARRHGKKCLDAANFSRVDPHIYSPPDYQSEPDTMMKAIEQVEAEYVKNEKREMSASELDIRLRRILA